MALQLSSIRIRNLALVEDLTWSPGAGFTAVTGETGSGKSIIVGALNLLVGERADKTLIRNGADSCTVEAVFETGEAAELNKQLAEMGVEECADGQLLIKRVLTSAGTNRQFINGSPTTLAVLKTLGAGLVDLHGPHDHQSLLSPETQRELLDAFAQSQDALRAYSTLFQARTRLLRELDELHGDDAAFERECALLAHQIEEIENADLREGEEEELHGRYTVATQASRLMELSSKALTNLVEADDAALGKVAELARTLREIERLDPSTADLGAAHVRAVSELEELARGLQRYSDSLDLDPGHLKELEDRVNLLETLKRKYGSTIEQVIAFGENAAERHRKLTSRAGERTRIQSELAALTQQIQSAGETLHALRKAAAPKLSKSVLLHLRDLGFPKADFSIALHQLPAAGLHGLEGVEFQFAPNPGEPPKPLRSIASSGEISRVMLAIKSSLAEQDTVPLLVFDEIDANVGGEIAHSVGEKMRALGGRRQVLCISHLPQVASKAHQQFVVSKEYAQGRTVSKMEQVTAAERETEIARMLGGKGSSALELARTLLSEH